MSPILISLISITEKLGIPVSVVEKTLKTEENQLSAIQMYNIKREIYGTFLYSDSSSETGYIQITCGPLLMAEVNFGLKEAEDNHTRIQTNPYKSIYISKSSFTKKNRR
ncbi:hypothetical protein OU489_000277 [Enterococcus hirae]|nr:hypothetical protein [Enterococcus hirae]